MKNLTRKSFLKAALLGIAAIKGKAYAQDAEKTKVKNISGAMFLEGKTINLVNAVLGDGACIQGPGTVILPAGSPALKIAGSNVRLSNIRIIAKGGKENHSAAVHLLETAANVRIDNCCFEGERYCVLKADRNSHKDSGLAYKKPVKGLHFQNNACEGSFSRHLYLHNVEGIVIEGNTFSNSLRDSIRLRQAVRSVIVSGNRFVNIGVLSKESADGIDAYWSGEEVLITSNIFENIATHGLDIKGISPDREAATSKVVIASNIFKNCRFSGVLLSSGALKPGSKNIVENFIVSSNMFTGCNQNGKNPNDAAIFLRHGVVSASLTGNHIFNHRGHGIVLGNFESGAGQTKNVIVGHNQIAVKGKENSCVASFGADGVVIKGNVFSKSNNAQALKMVESYKGFKSASNIIGDNLESIVNDHAGDDNSKNGAGNSEGP